jgi:hypothetical protein
LKKLKGRTNTKFAETKHKYQIAETEGKMKAVFKIKPRSIKPCSDTMLNNIKLNKEKIRT